MGERLNRSKKVETFLSNTEKLILQRKINTFAGIDKKVQINYPCETKFGFNAREITVNGKKEGVSFKLIEFDGNLFSDPYFNSIVSSSIFTATERENIEKYIYQNNGKLAVFYRTKSDPNYMQAIKEHAGTHFGEISGIELQLGAAHNGNSHAAGFNEEIRNLSNSSFQFVALTEDPKINSIVAKINELNNANQVIYAANLAIAEIARERSLRSATIMCATPFIWGATEVAQFFKLPGSDLLAKVLSQVSGEFLQMAIFEGKDTRRSQRIENQDAINNKLQKDLKRMQILTMAGVVALASTFSIISETLNSMPVYSAIPAVDTFALAGYQIAKKHKEFSNLKITEQQFEYLLERFPYPIQKALRRFPPSVTLALVDFENNPYAVGDFIGELAASASILPMYELGVPILLIYIFSGAIIGPGSGLIIGWAAQMGDRYDKFSNKETVLNNNRRSRQERLMVNNP